VADSISMAEPRSFPDVIVDTAYHKLMAARARANPDTRAEKPRDAIIAGLSLVTEALNYSFSASQLRLERKRGDLTFRLNIQSDRNNVAGQRAAILVHPAIYSRAVSAWSKRHPSEWIRPKTPLPLPFVGSQIGYMGEPKGWMTWDFADPASRRETAEDLAQTIRSRVEPFFAAFDGPVEGIAALPLQPGGVLPEMRAAGILTYLLAHGHKSLALQTLTSYFDARPKDRAEFEAKLHEFAGNGLPEFRSLGVSDLAAFAVATGYPWS